MDSGNSCHYNCNCCSCYCCRGARKHHWCRGREREKFSLSVQSTTPTPFTSFISPMNEDNCYCHCCRCRCRCYCVRRCRVILQSYKLFRPTKMCCSALSAFPSTALNFPYEKRRNTPLDKTNTKKITRSRVATESPKLVLPVSIRRFMTECRA